jgi:uncharacterized protein
MADMASAPSAFRSYLRSELARRCRDNESYSLRAFARDLEIDHASLSQLLRSSRTVTVETVRRLGARLALSEAMLEAFCARAREPAPTGSSNLASEAATVIVEPLHAEVLALVAGEGMVADSTLIARVLDVDVDAVNVAVQRLLYVGLLVMTSAQVWTSRLAVEALEPRAFEWAVWRWVASRLEEGAPRTDRGPEGGGDPAPSPVEQFQLLAKDPTATAAFYGTLFGWSIDASNALGYRKVSTGPDGIAGGIWPVPPGAPALVQLFVRVDDVARAAARASELGATVLVPPQVLPDGDEMALLLDPEGRSVGVFTPKSHARTGVAVGAR